MRKPSLKTTSLQWLTALSLAFLCLFGLARPALAHALPGTTINILVNPTWLDLTISLPLHELELAMPGGTALAQPDGPGQLPPAQLEKLAAYFGAHLAVSLSNGTYLAAKLTDARVEPAHDDHVGTFDLLVITVTAPLANGAKAVPITLFYDAVMHEVRNHMAAVMVQSPGHSAVLAGYIHFDPDLGKAAPFDLPRLP